MALLSKTSTKKKTYINIQADSDFLTFARQLSLGLVWGRYPTAHPGLSRSSLHSGIQQLQKKNKNNKIRNNNNNNNKRQISCISNAPRLADFSKQFSM